MPITDKEQLLLLLHNIILIIIDIGPQYKPPLQTLLTLVNHTHNKCSTIVQNPRRASTACPTLLQDAYMDPIGFLAHNHKNAHCTQLRNVQQYRVSSL